MVIQNKRILIVTDSSDNGHVQATQSIVNRLDDMNLDHLSVIEHDLFIKAHPVLTSTCGKWYTNSLKYFKDIYKGFCYSHPDRLDKCFYKYYGLNRLINLLIKEKPDSVLLTLPTPVMSVLAEQSSINIPVAAVMAGYRLHKNWIMSYLTRYYVVIKETGRDFIDVGTDPSTVKVAGIPINNKFETPIGQKQWLIDNNLNPDKQTILMSTSVFGIFKGSDTMTTDTLAKSANAQVVMICGKSKGLKRSLTAKSKFNENVLTLGYVKYMNGWMASSQLIITKPGGITITEGFARCILMIFLNFALGQELENTPHSEEKDFGKIADTPEEATKIMANLTNGSKQLTSMIGTVEQDKIEYTTQTVCQNLLNLIGRLS